MSQPIDDPRFAVFTMYDYIGLNSLIGRAIGQFPINAAYRASQLQRQNPNSVAMADPRNNPSRSQFSEGYTAPFQYFASSNTWQTPSGQTSRGRRASQPSTKFVGPRVAIQTQMPWG